MNFICMLLCFLYCNASDNLKLLPIESKEQRIKFFDTNYRLKYLRKNMNESIEMRNKFVTYKAFVEDLFHKKTLKNQKDNNLVKEKSLWLYWQLKKLQNNLRRFKFVIFKESNKSKHVINVIHPFILKTISKYIYYIKVQISFHKIYFYNKIYMNSDANQCLKDIFIKKLEEVIEVKHKFILIQMFYIQLIAHLNVNFISFDIFYNEILNISIKKMKIKIINIFSEIKNTNEGNIPRRIYLYRINYKDKIMKNSVIRKNILNLYYNFYYFNFLKRSIGNFNISFKYLQEDILKKNGFLFLKERFVKFGKNSEIIDNFLTFMKYFIENSINNKLVASEKIEFIENRIRNCVEYSFMLLMKQTNLLKFTRIIDDGNISTLRQFINLDFILPFENLIKSLAEYEVTKKLKLTEEYFYEYFNFYCDMYKNKYRISESLMVRIKKVLGRFIDGNLY